MYTYLRFRYVRQYENMQLISSKLVGEKEIDKGMNTKREKPSTIHFTRFVNDFMHLFIQAVLNNTSFP